MLKLFLLEREGSRAGESRGFVVAAQSEQDARRFAAEASHWGNDFGQRNPWLSSVEDEGLYGSTCKEIGVGGEAVEPGIVLLDENPSCC